MSKRIIGVIEITLAGIAFGFLGLFGKIAFRQGITVGELLTYRFAAATLILGLGLALISPRRLKISRRDLGVCAILGLFGYAVFSTFYFISIRGTSIALAALILHAYPLFVAVGAHFLFKERLTKVQILALPLAFVGVAILLHGPLSGEPCAIAAGFMSAVCYAAYILYSSRTQKNIDPLTSGVYVMLFATLGLAVFHHPSRTSLTTEQLLNIAGLAVVGTVTPLVLFLSGLQKLGNTEASILATIEPVTAAVAGSLLLHENLKAYEIIGGLIVIAALALTVWTGQKPAPAQALE